MTLDFKELLCFEYSFEFFLQEEKFVLEKKINTKRFLRIGKCPEHIIVQQKCFEYDLDPYQRYKVNDIFEFNVAPHIVSKKFCVYKHTGIIIQDGNTEFWHFYSLIKITGK